MDLSKRTMLLIIALTIFLPVIVFASSRIISIRATDHQSGISKILLPNGEIIDSDEVEYTVYENGLYKFIAYDHAGNIAQEFYIQISDIADDKEVESVIEEVEEELDKLEGEEKEKLEEKLNNIKEEYDDDIKSRIEEIDKSIDNMTSIGEANKIRESIENLPEQYQTDKYTSPLEEEKNRLNQKLDDKIKELETISNNKLLQQAIEAVEKAEKTIKQKDVDSAWEIVNKLPEGKNRNELSDRLNIVQEQIFAIDKITEDIENMTKPTEKDKIQKEIDKLPDGDIKDELQDMLDKKAKKLANESKNNNDNNNDDYKNKGDSSSLLKQAIKAVEKAEKTIKQKDVDGARIKVNQLPSSVTRDSLNRRLDLVQMLIDKEKEEMEEEIEGSKDKDQDKDNSRNEDERLIEEVKDAVEKAEKTKSDKDIKNAKDKIKELPDSTIKDIFTERIRLVERMKELEEKIGKAENVLYQSSNVSSSSGTSNREYIYINDSVLEPYTEDEEDIKNNPYYKKPPRGKQSNLFKLKEVETISKEDIEIEDDLEVEEVKEVKNNNKIPIIIFAVILLAIVVLAILIISKKKAKI